MIDWLAATTQARPDGLALIADGQHYTYAELNAQVARVCATLAAHGIQRESRVAVLMPNSVEYIYAIHALARLGATLVLINIRLTVDEVRWQVEKADCSHLIFSEETAATAQSVASDRLNVIAAEALLNESGAGFLRGEIDLDMVQAIVFTSGTTGRPKGAMLTFGNQFWGATASAFRLGTLPEDRWLLCMPLYHVGGLAIVLRCALYGTTVVLQPGFDADAVMDAVQTQAVTLVSLVPTTLYRLLDAYPDRPLPPSLRLILLGGAAAPAALIERCVRAGIPVATSYGLTEACSQVATLPPDAIARKPGCVGKPLTFTSVRVVDEHDSDVPSGVYGEVVASGPTIMRGYLDQAPANGSFDTGDIGYLDADGDLWIVQRRSDLIVSGGENVYPAEVEAVLREHPDVADVCVVGLPSEEWGQQVAAAVVPRVGATPTAAALVAYARRRLAGYKVPRMIRFFDSLPQTASGKVHRQSVIARL